MAGVTACEGDPASEGLAGRWDRRAVLRLLGGSAAAVGLGACSGSSGDGDGTATTRRGSTTTRGSTSSTGATSTSTTGATTTTAGSTAATEADWTALARALPAGLTRPSDRRYPVDKQLFNPLFDGVRPQGIAHCRSAADVATCLRFAEDHGVPFAVRGGGHSFAGYSTSTGLVIDLGAMSGIGVGRSGSADVGAGARLIDVYAGLAGHGVMIPAGSCPSVGIAGLTLGGGVGVVSRKYGLTIDSLDAVEIVLADGRQVTCDADHEPDLFWALRGAGGGSFGVVTSFRFRTNPAPSLALGGMRWPWGAAERVLEAWQEWAPSAPDELWSNALLLAGDERGGDPTVRVGAVYVGSSDALDGLLADLARRVGVAPSHRYRLHKGYLDAMRFEGGCSDTSVRACRPASEGGSLAREASVARAEYLAKPLSAHGRSVVVDAVERHQRDPQLRGGGVAFDAYGGAINRVAPDATAFVHRTPICGVLLNGTFPDDAPAAMVDAARAWVDGLGRDLAGEVDGEAYQNYVDPRRTDWAAAYYGSNLARLQRVKAHYDPHDRFHFPQSIPLP
jgi:FAD/FMN-containing dehydrogenase